MEHKSSLRAHFLELLRKQGSQERQDKSHRIAEQLFALPAFQKANTVLFYASMPGEVETFAMITRAIQLKKRVALPVILRDQRNMIPTLTDSIEDLHSGPYNIRQPRLDASKSLDVHTLDAVIVPGLAFDKANNRLGRGAGYYDRFLSGLPQTTAKIGIAFDFQMVDCLPTEEHDVPLDLIIAK
jgi:5-formyltetrahydrofolate cyclo-ligase